MTTINQLTKTDAVVSGDLFPLYKSGSGDARAAAASVLLAYMQANLTFTSAGRDSFYSEYSSPSTTGFNVTITDGLDDSNSIHLMLTPTGTLAAGTITLPAVASVVDKQEVLVNCTQIVTTLTVAGNGATVTGAPTTLAGNDFFRLKFDGITSTWFRVG